MRTDRPVVSLPLVIIACELQTEASRTFETSWLTAELHISLFLSHALVGATFFWFTFSCRDILRGHSLHCAGHEVDYTFFSQSISAASKLHSFHHCL
jgi:hypothetical protein